MKIFIADDLAGFTENMRDAVQHWLKNDADETAEIKRDETPVRIMLSSLTKSRVTGDSAKQDSPNPSLIAQPEFSSDILDAVGAELLHLGHVEQAAPFIEAALRGRIKLYGKDHPITAQSYNTRARLKRMQGDVVGAEKDARRALAINSRVYGTDSYATSISLTELAMIQVQAGEYAAAEKSAARGLDILEHLYLDSSDPNTTRLMDVLGRVLQMRANYEQAVELYQRILQQDIKEGSDCSLKYATHLANFALVLLSQGKLSDAAEYYKEAIDIYAVKAGVPNHPDLLDIRAGYASLLAEQGNAAGARDEFTKLIELGLKLRGDDHLYVGNDYAGRARAIYRLDDLNGAKADFDRALAVYRKNVDAGRIPDDHAFIAEAKAWKARVMVEQVADADPQEQQRVGLEAEKLATHALRKFQAEFEEDSVEIAITNAILARALALQGKDQARALALLTAALPIVVAARGEDSKIARLIREWIEDIVGKG